MHNNDTIKHSSGHFKVGAVIALVACSVLGLVILAASGFSVFGLVVWSIFTAICMLITGVSFVLFQLVKNFFCEANTSKEKKGRGEGTELQESTPVTPEGQKTPDRDSALGEDKDSFVTATEQKNYKYELTATDIRDIGKAHYSWVANKGRKGLKSASKGVLFSCLNNTSSLKNEVQEYKNKIKQGDGDGDGDGNLIFTSILNINDNHWVTLSIVCNSNKKPRARSNSVESLNCSNKEGEKLKRRLSLGNEDNNTFRAYYCDPFGKPLPDEISNVLQETLGINSSNVGTSKEKQQTDTWSCGILALENTNIITNTLKTDALKVGESFVEIDAKLKYTLSPEQLIEKRKEFAKALERAEQSRPDSKNSDGSSVSLDSGISVGSEESKQTQRTEVKKYNTSGDRNNCFFHSVFGQNNSGQYSTEKAEKMREEWYKFLKGFESLDDCKMSNALIKQMQTVFTMFLDRPQDLTGKSDEIKRLVEQTNKKIKEADSKTKELIEEIIKNFRDDGDLRKEIYSVIERAINQRNKRNIDSPRDQKTLLSVEDLLKEENRKRLYNDIVEDLESCALIFNRNLSKREYGNTYDPKVIKDSFINDESVYKAYREAIRGSYCVFIEEIPILASLAGIEIIVYHQNNGNDVRTVSEPNPEIIEMFNSNTNSVEVYQRNSELWGDKKQETIYLKPGHYERAKVVGLEGTQSFVGTVVQVFTNTLGLTNT